MTPDKSAGPLSDDLLGAMLCAAVFGCLIDGKAGLICAPIALYVTHRTLTQWAKEYA